MTTDILVKVAPERLNGHWRANVEVSSMMRCEAINAPSTRLDLRLHRREAYSKPKNHEFVFPCVDRERERERETNTLETSQAGSMVPLRLADCYSLRPRIISIYYPTLRVLAALAVPIASGPDFFLLFHYPFNRAPSPTRRKEETSVIYEDASITTAPCDMRVVLYRSSFDTLLSWLPSIQSLAKKRSF